MTRVGVEVAVAVAVAVEVGLGMAVAVAIMAHHVPVHPEPHFSQSPGSTLHADPEQLAISVPAHALAYVHESEPKQAVRGKGS